MAIGLKIRIPPLPGRARENGQVDYEVLTSAEATVTAPFVNRALRRLKHLQENITLAGPDAMVNVVTSRTGAMCTSQTMRGPDTITET